MTAETCEYGPCDRAPHSRGLCGTHYQQRRRGEALHPPHSTRRLSRTTPEQRRRTARESDLKNRYGISLSKYEQILAGQGGACAICRSANPGKRQFSVDHDHSCCPGPRSCGGCVRGLLCGACNSGIGLLNDDPDRLLSAALYVLTHSREAVSA